MLDIPETRDPERSFAPPDEKAVAAAVTVTAQVSQNRSIVIQTYVERDADISTYHEVLDKAGNAITRQEARLNIEEQEQNLYQEEKALRNLKEDLVAIETRSQAAWDRANKRGAWRLTEAEIAQKTNATTNVKRYEEAIFKRKADIAKLKAIIAEGD